MGSFADDISRFNIKLEGLVQAEFVAVVAECKNSIVFGSPLTGAPGQVVDDEMGGNLRNSWQVEFPEPDHAIISTNVAYAESNEDGIARPSGGPYIQRSATGGRWNVALTRTGFSRIVDDVANKLAEGGDQRPAGFQDNSVMGGSGS